MEIVQATAADLPEMINLLKMSLGESLVPKSEKYFLWKHEQNPFGKSYTCLARENDQLIGLRTFMRWKWQKGNEVLSAVRAVDTATHPAHQGKGIFRKLTMNAVEACKAEGVHLVFNSPNNQSRPGYLKMGWKEVGRMPLLLKPGSIIPAKYSDARAEEIYSAYNFEQVEPVLRGMQYPVSDDYFHTPLSDSYILWRYKECPVARYGVISEADKFGIIFRLKPAKGFIELRLCEIWTMDKQGETLARRALKKLTHRVSPLFVSCALSPLSKARLAFFGPFKKGPVTTIRQLCMEDLTTFEKFNQWRPSLGSMELF